MEPKRLAVVGALVSVMLSLDASGQTHRHRPPCRTSETRTPDMWCVPREAPRPRARPAPTSPTCSGGRMWNGAAERCECPASMPNWHSERSACVAGCVAGAAWQAARNECVCDDATPDFDRAQNRCVPRAVAAVVAAPSPPTPPAASGSCPSGMIPIAGGDFSMGDGSEHSRAPRSVRVGAFCMDRTEVSVTSYRACVTAGACTEPSPFRNVRGDWNLFCNWGRSGAETHPVNCVDWTQSTAYCMWAGGRLPTEEEWEYAARGREGRVWAWGNAGIDGTRANLCGDECSSYGASSGFSGWPSYPGHHDEYAVTAPVDSLPAGATPEGLLNMTGNVWEWTSTVDGNNRINRGGSWNHSEPSWVRAASRDAGDPAYRLSSLGFRCARGAR